MAKKDKPRESPKDSSKVWTIFSLASALLAGALVRKALDRSWKTATGKNPPANPADPDVDLKEALLWATVSGTAIGIGRMLAGRKAAHYYTRSTGHLPPGLKKGQDSGSQGV